MQRICIELYSLEKFIHNVDLTWTKSQQQRGRQRVPLLLNLESSFPSAGIYYISLGSPPLLAVLHIVQHSCRCTEKS